MLKPPLLAICSSPAEASRVVLEEKLNLLATRRSEYSDKLHRIAGENRRAVEEDFVRMLATLKSC